MDDLAFAIHNMQETLLIRVSELNLNRLTADEALELCDLHRRIGCGLFLAEGDEQPLFEGLYRSAYTYLHFLSTLARGEDGPEVARTRSTPMIDALAAAQRDLALQIDELLPTTQSLDLEDDEDFTWYSSLHALGIGTLDSEGLDDVADQYLASGSEFLRTRGKALKAIASSDADAFDEALAQFTNEWHEAVEEAREPGVTDLGADLTEWNLFLEGAALVRAARAMGMAVASFYRYIPAELIGEPPAGLGDEQ